VKNRKNLVDKQFGAKYHEVTKEKSKNKCIKQILQKVDHTRESNAINSKQESYAGSE
jgi:hypothetical protein